MKRLDDGRVTLVDFLRSIKFRQQERPQQTETKATGNGIARFADFQPRARRGARLNNEDAYLVRSGN